jgi:hypothetical protein
MLILDLLGIFESVDEVRPKGALALKDVQKRVKNTNKSDLCIKGPFGINSILKFYFCFYHFLPFEIVISKILFLVFLTCLMASDAPLDIFEIITAVLPYTLAGYMKTECRNSALSGAAYYQELQPS